MFSTSGPYGSYGGVTLHGDTLYGTTVSGGAYAKGTVYKIHTSGTNFTVLHDFTGGDGHRPNSTLVADGSTLYGTAYYGGSSDLGVVFKMETNGADYTVLHEFSGGLNDGRRRASVVRLLPSDREWRLRPDFRTTRTSAGSSAYRSVAPVRPLPADSLRLRRSIPVRVSFRRNPMLPPSLPSVPREEAPVRRLRRDKLSS